MVGYECIVAGLQKYIDTEIVSKMGGWQRWVFGTSAGVMLSRAPSVIEQAKNNPMLKASGVISDSGKIDIDAIYGEAIKQARETGQILIQIPMIGNLKIGPDDVEMLYRYIKENAG